MPLILTEFQKTGYRRMMLQHTRLMWQGKGKFCPMIRSLSAWSLISEYVERALKPNSESRRSNVRTLTPSRLATSTTLNYNVRAGIQLCLLMSDISSNLGLRGKFLEIQDFLNIVDDWDNLSAIRSQAVPIRHPPPLTFVEKSNKFSKIHFTAVVGYSWLFLWLFL